ncbi:Bcr/CflA family multidrug efflux MFS transporter [Rosenbergiella australiborealis]|uniref:Bcr/CflA family efflux transporter n=1 Tax=Rosenbergiella australiborealis TaxID=1544696 RepID=A0ABS5T698_9GAMM|nr:purine nucleoside transporter PunC [Rosenbergiella australiborealis]MBT0726508.1 Bcr/CflA family multidrug efflux MFS transporter [Rosenbergiella australiborealis]
MQHPKLFFIYLALLSMLGFLATDMYLPAFSAMQHSLSTSATMVSASLSLFLAGFCCAQLFWGPLSDKIGRRKVLLYGLSLFTLSCLAVVWVRDARILLVLRFLQASGVCAAAVCWQSLVLDHYPKEKAHKMFAAIMPLVALSPALAPLIGAWLITHFTWQVIFLVLMLISLVLLIFTVLLLPANRPSAKATETILSYKQLLSQPIFTGNVLIYAACSASFFAWLTGSPFIMGQLGLNPNEIGLSYIPQTITFLIGGFGCRALLNRYRGEQLLPGLLFFYAISIIALLIVGLWMTPSLTLLLIPFSVMAMSNGAIYPIVVSKALKTFPQHSGKAASVQNFTQLGLCFLYSLWVSSQVYHALSITVIAMATTVILSLVGYLYQAKSSSS